MLNPRSKSRFSTGSFYLLVLVTVIACQRSESLSQAPSPANQPLPTPEALVVAEPSPQETVTEETTTEESDPANTTDTLSNSNNPETTTVDATDEPDSTVASDATSDEVEEVPMMNVATCTQLKDDYDRGSFEDAHDLETQILEHDSTIASVEALNQGCAEALDADIPFALSEVAVMLDEYQADGAVSDRTRASMTAGDCWLLAGAYTGNGPQRPVVEENLRDDLATDNVIGQHCAALLDDEMAIASVFQPAP